MIIGDAIEVMSSMTDSFDAVVTSPPYNIGVNYGLGINDRLSQEEYNDFTSSWVSHALAIAPVCVVNFGAPSSKPMNLAHFMNSVNLVGHIQSDIIWLKSLSTEEFSIGHFKPVNSKRYITNLVEHVFVISRDGNFPLDRLSIGVPFKDKSNITRFKSNKRDIRCRGNVWFVPYETRTAKLEHPASYPIKLAEMMIKLSGGKRILDPFAGSGTTKAAADRLGFECVMIDKRQW